MNLYRAEYQCSDGKVRPLTFAARDAEDAERTAQQWTCGDRLIAVRLDRALQTPLLVLT